MPLAILYHREIALQKLHIYNKSSSHSWSGLVCWFHCAHTHYPEFRIKQCLVGLELGNPERCDIDIAYIFIEVYISN